MKKINLKIISLYIFSIFLTYYFVSFSVKSNIDQKILNKSHISSVILDSFFTNIFNVVQDKAKKISINSSKINNTDIKDILSRDFGYNIFNTSIPIYTFWPKFVWINKEDKISVTSYDGVLERKENLIFEKHHFLSKTNHWEMFFSDPKKDRYGQDVIDLSVGVGDDNGNYVGIMMARLEINKIITLINNVIQSDSFKYIVYNNKRVLFSSDDNSDLDQNNNLKQFLKNSNNQGIINNRILIGDNYFNKLNKLSNFPVYLISGYNQKSLNSIIFKYFILYSIIISIIFCLIFFAYYLLRRELRLKSSRFRSMIKKDKYLSRKLYKELTQLLKSKKSNDKFLMDVILRSNKNIDIIKNNIEQLLKIQINNNDLDVNYKLDIYDDILTKISKIEFLLPSNLEPKKIDIIEAIYSAIDNNRDLKIKFNIDVNFSYRQDVRFIECDELILVQIMSSLIYSAYMNQPSSKININLSKIFINKKEYINIIITDDGIGLNDDDKKYFKVDNFHRYNLNNIKKLISLCNCKINFKDEYSVGTQVTVSFPIKIEQNKINKIENPKITQNKKNNIISFPLNENNNKFT
jgi:signal transduction histidine kinase